MQTGSLQKTIKIVHSYIYFQLNIILDSLNSTEVKEEEEDHSTLKQTRDPLISGNVPGDEHYVVKCLQQQCCLCNRRCIGTALANYS